MPQLGETVTEGTITKWLKQVGEQVAVDEPLFEVSTDKVDSEVPSPVAGVLTEIVVPEGDTVEVGRASGGGRRRRRTGGAGSTRDRLGPVLTAPAPAGPTRTRGGVTGTTGRPCAERAPGCSRAGVAARARTCACGTGDVAARAPDDHRARVGRDVDRRER